MSVTLLTQLSVSATLSDPDLQSNNFTDCTCSKKRQNHRRNAVSKDSVIGLVVSLYNQSIISYSVLADTTLFIRL